MVYSERKSLVFLVSNTFLLVGVGRVKYLALEESKGKREKTGGECYWKEF